MRVTPADLGRLIRSFLFSIHPLLFGMVLVLVPAADVSAQSQGSGSDDTPPQSEGIQKGWNELGVWGGISFHSTTLIGKTPDARFGNIGLRYARVLVASETVAFSWTIDAVPVAVLSNPRFTAVPSGSGFVVTQSRKS